jgi:hypothetical protein
MNNPTLGNSQFTSPFNILPDVKLPNPTRPETAQFKSPYDILPNIKYSSPLIDGVRGNQFNPQMQMGNQVTFNLLPDPKLFNPTAFQTQFNKPQTLGSFQTFDIADVPDPSIPLLTPYTKPPIIYLSGEALPNQYFTNWYYRPFQNVRYRFNTIAQSRSSNVINIASAIGGAFVGAGALTGLTAGLSFTPNLIATAGGNQFNTPFATLAKNQLRNATRLFGSELSRLLDYRSRILSKFSKRQDGNFIKNESVRAKQYYTAADSKEGAYSTFNLKDTYGWGEHDAPGANRTDFTRRTAASTQWSRGNNGPAGWIQQKSNDPLDPLESFRGDKVNVIDFKNSATIAEAYDWKPRKTVAIGTDFETSEVDPTQDFIKFFLTGPTLQNGLTDAKDDIMVFRAAITQLNDSFNANWTPVQFIGRADPNYHYTGYSRDLSLGFDVYATSRDELKFIWRKLNALAGYTAPEYNAEDIALRAPWLRITVGDLFVQQPVVLNSLSYDYATDASWEINIEDDPTNMQVPFKISVSCQFNMITDYLPQKGGRFFTLAKSHDATGKPIEGSDNWLSDSYGNSKLKPKETLQQADIQQQGNDEVNRIILESLAEALGFESNGGAF